MGKLTKEEIKGLCEDIACSKLSRKELARKYNVSYPYITSFIRENFPYKQVKKHPVVTKEIRQGIINYFFNNQDNRLELIGVEFGVSRATVANVIKAEMDRRFEYAKKCRN